MIINSENIEFGYELISVVPYAYYHYLNGNLEGTVSGNDTGSLYYFSPNHKINKEQRDYHNIAKVKYPNAWIHKPYLDKKEFAIPDYKKQFANDKFKFDKETVIICNRYNTEWGYKPINYFSLDTLKELFELLQDKYQVVYINVDGREELYDNAPPEPLGDWELLKQYPKIINFHDLVEESFNETQLKVFANCSKFVTMNGGHAILASYFRGENIVMSKFDKIYAKEIKPGVNSFYTFYHEFSGQRVVSVHSERELIERIKIQWLEDNPVVNVLVRTSKRPDYFDACINSINAQTYKNVNIFVSKDDTSKYTIDYKVYPVYVERQEIEPVCKENYGIPFPANLYFNELHKHVKDGLIIYLDDDDTFTDIDAINNIVKEYKKGNDLIFWRVKVGKRTVPSNKNWKKPPVCKDISGIGFAFDHKYKLNWEAYKLGDFRIADKLYKKIKNKSYINKVLTKTQGSVAGFGLRIDKNEINMKTFKIKFTKVKKGSKHKSGEVKELPSHVAKQFVITGQAIFVEDDSKLKEVVKDFNEVKKEVKKPKAMTTKDIKKPAKKKGRPKKTA
jgi:hypothetical protein